MIRPALAALLAFSTLAPAAWATEPVLALSTATYAGKSVTLLRDSFIESQRHDERSMILDQLAKTAPRSGPDVAHLFDLFSRFSDDYTRRSVMASLLRLGPGNPHLEPLFMTYLRQPEPEAQLFGINGAFLLRSREALPLIREIAGRKFSARAVTETTMMTERNAWWTQYEALSVLAQWEPEKSASLLERKGRESAKVGSLLGQFYWKQTLPKLKGWVASGELIAVERAALAAAAPIEPADARATRPQMLALLRDLKLDPGIRHQLALKIGVTSTNEEAEALVREHDASSMPEERLYWAAAAFSSRSPKVVPLLVRYASQAEDPIMRKGTTAQLVDMLGKDEAATLIDHDKKEVK